jgi:hypothetical protein
MKLSETIRERIAVLCHEAWRCAEECHVEPTNPYLKGNLKSVNAELAEAWKAYDRAVARGA